MRRQLAPSRQDARAAIEAGTVLVSGAPADKPARLVAPGEPIVVVGPPSPFVSRGGRKLEAALDRFDVVVQGRHVLDAGASTGGFTDCLLQRGAAQVYAVDVGHGQLDPSLRGHPRVTVLERINVRTLNLDTLRAADPAFEPCPLVVADLSFISLRTVVPALAGEVAAPGADLVLLVKPQFEAGRAAVSRGKGVVRDPALWLAALEGVTSALVSAGTGIMGAMVSPLTGPSGNVEFLLHARKGPEATGREVEVADLLAGAVSEAEDRAAAAAAGRRRSGRLSRPVPMATVTFLVHPKRPDALELATETAQWLTERGDVARILRFSGPDRVTEDGVECDLGDVDLSGTDVAVSLGGDGIFLRVVRLAGAADVPVLGVNFGRLGYLPDLVPDQVREALKKVLEGKAAIEARCALEVTITDRSMGDDVSTLLALNEVVIEKIDFGHTVRLATTIDGEQALTYSADGLIIATPTGSTAYNLSAGGPILAPTLRAMVVTPVAPHFSFDRSLVLTDDQEVAVEVAPDRAGVLVIDGQEVGRLQPGCDHQLPGGVAPGPGGPQRTAQLRHDPALPTAGRPRGLRRGAGRDLAC